MMLLILANAVSVYLVCETVTWRPLLKFALFIQVITSAG